MKSLEYWQLNPYPYFIIDGSTLNLVNEEKDLEIWCAGDLKLSCSQKLF